MNRKLRVLLATVALIIALPAAQASRNDVIAALESLVPRTDPFELSVQREEDRIRVVIGDPVVLRMHAGRPAFIRLIAVNAHGVLEITDPIAGLYGNRLEANIPTVLPGESDPSRVLIARMPGGIADLFVLATEQPLPAPEGAAKEQDETWVLSASEGARFAARWAERIRAGEFGDASARRITVEFVADREYTPDQIVDYFVVQTRSVCSPKLDVYVNFEFGTTEITAESLPRVDTWARALSDPLMARERFQIGGHTDDVGNESYNFELSERRAHRVRELLVARGVDAGRLSVRGFGQDLPLLEGDSEYVRAANRRVDFERLTGSVNPVCPR